MLKLIDLEVYKVALEIGDRVWKIIDGWDHFNKDTLGKQFVKAADSIALNIAEGYGRFFYKENKNFNYYSRGSAFECTSCLRKALKRNLITVDENLELRKLFEKYLKLINSYIKSIGQDKRIDTLQEEETAYSLTNDNLDNLLVNDLMTIDSLTNDK